MIEIDEKKWDELLAHIEALIDYEYIYSPEKDLVILHEASDRVRYLRMQLLATRTGIDPHHMCLRGKRKDERS